MTQERIEEAIRHTVVVQVPADEAFAVFTDEIDAWWPSAYTWAKDTLDTFAIEPGEGGRCFERGPHGFECDWGRVLAWEPPHRLVLSWQISAARVPEPNPAKASEIEVRFIAEGPKETQVELEHRSFSNHGEDAAEYRAAMGSEQGWPYILDCYAETVK